MTLKQWFAVSVLTSLPFAATAQQTPQQPGPPDANATVPASAYESAFKNYRAAANEQESPELEESPDKTWRTANDEMAKLGGHAGHMKDAPASSMSPSTPAQAAPVDHGKHH
jgi:hypothetical protein